MWWEYVIDLDKLIAGFWFATGTLLALILTSAMRGVSTAGGKAFVYVTALAHSWLRYRNGTDNTINVTLNTTREGVLTIDTWIDEHQLPDIWHNAYHVMRLNKMASFCTTSDPLIKFRYKAKKKWHFNASGGAPKYNEYRRTYDRLVNKIAAALTNQNSLDYSLGKAMIPHRYVVALTYEKLCDLRAQHFRVMLVREEELLNFPEMVRFNRPEHATRFETLRAVALQYKEDYALNPIQPERFGILLVWRPLKEKPDVA